MDDDPPTDDGEGVWENELLVSVVLALLSMFLQFGISKHLEKIQEMSELNRVRNTNNLDRIQWQLGEVFGPIRMICLCTKTAFSALVARHSDNDHTNLTDMDTMYMIQRVNEPVVDGNLNAVQKDWILWMNEINQPLNKQVLSIITTKAHAFDRKIPDCFVDLMAHICEFDVIMKKWEDSDFSHMNTTILYPDGIHKYINDEYERLRLQKRNILKDLDSLSEMPEDEDADAHHSELHLQREIRKEKTRKGLESSAVVPLGHS
jgi:hypothetical protein